MNEVTAIQIGMRYLSYMSDEEKVKLYKDAVNDLSHKLCGKGQDLYKSEAAAKAHLESIREEKRSVDRQIVYAVELSRTFRFREEVAHESGSTVSTDSKQPAA